jgi:ketosteroid isomerase-like protein
MMLSFTLPRSFAPFFALAGLLLAALSTTPKVLAAPSDDVLAAENARVEALLRADYDALDRLLGEDLTYTHSTAVLDTKAMFMESLRSGRLRYHQFRHEDPKVRVLGDIGIINSVARIVAVNRGQENRNHLRVTIVYAKRDGRWQMVAWQSTRMPPS